ncbi:glucosamine-6-phosphate deaminase [Alkaliphilus peptidifermentans]|uniref:Glucosamine-6-phosphate deaminase n=1 Tax=Alkaliphilus peptidifermentans DSM 18978 TaxID=1120976 RepID=A0A1G5BKC0_9FIRM|nr:glucosamine-6-phosphate deaminase [Alkaliphilus peptidifermentans]SCX90546.1 glucosamine-6-phosphate deaminase [Alkaliphilus peptidifermentans DSM 18978]
MKIIILKDSNELSKRAAQILANQIMVKPNSSIGLATGDTPLGMYKELIKLYLNNCIDFSRTTTFNLDEYYGLKPDDPKSYYYYMYNNLFKYVNIDYENVNIPNGICESIEDECNRYEKEIEKAGGIDLQILGIGRNGHVGFNEPDANFEAKTHIIHLKEDTILANSRFFTSPNEVPKKAISMGIKSIMRSRKILLLAKGIEKATAIFQTVNGKITPQVPASILQLHPNVTLILDLEAASLLKSNEINGAMDFPLYNYIE